MAGDPFKPVLPGERLVIPATAWNEMLRLVRTIDPLKLSKAAQYQRPFGLIKVKNETGSDLSQFSVVGIDGPIIAPDDNIDEFKRQVTFRGVVPTSEHVGKWAVFTTAVPNGVIGEAVGAGLVQVRMTVDANEVEDYAECVDGSTDVVQNAPEGSATVVWCDDEGVQSQEGERWAIVRLDGGNSAMATETGVYPRGVRCIDGDFWEVEFRPSGMVKLTKIACGCDVACLDDTPPDHEDECCGNYPDTVCLQFSTTLNTSNQTTRLGGKSVTLTWYDNLPAHPTTANVDSYSGYYVSTTDNLSDTYKVWLVRGFPGSGTVNCPFQAMDVNGSNQAVMWTVRPELALNGPAWLHYWTCSPFNMVIRVPASGNNSDVQATVTSGNCPNPGAGSGSTGYSVCGCTGVSAVLVATITSKVGWAECLPDTLTLVYNETTNPGLTAPGWYATLGTCCTVTAYFQLRCNAGNWEIAIVNSTATLLGSGTGTITSPTCEPLNLVCSTFAMAATNTCFPGATGSCMVVITE